MTIPASNGYRSAIRCHYHITEATTSLAVAAGHLAKARETDPDPAKADIVYRHLLRDIGLASVTARALTASRQPDLEREAAAFDARQEGATA